MFSVMTVVLPHTRPKTGTRPSPAPDATVNTRTARSGPAGQSCRGCDYRCCNVEKPFKSSVSLKCPLLKDVDGRHPHCSAGGQSNALQPHSSLAREWLAIQNSACYWREKYDRLHENQRRLQKMNESLEEKLSHIAEKHEIEKSDLTKDVTDLTSKLVEARLTIAELEEENEQYRNDCNIAVRLLQCKPSSFVAHKFNSLPADFQVKVKRHLSRPSRGSASFLLDQCPPDVRTIKVSVPTVPTAKMVYAVNKSNTAAQPAAASVALGEEDATPDHISAAIIAKVLEERGQERMTALLQKKHRAPQDNRDKLHRCIGTQTDHHWPAHCRCQIIHGQSKTLHDLATPSKDPSRISSTETAI